jgi:undecaprenyl-diphosphatase
MPWERSVLLAIHRMANPFLDAVFVVSHAFGTFEFAACLVLVVAFLHAARGRRREAIVWLLVGISTALLQAELKLFFHRARPMLWPRLVEAPAFSWPSGHALSCGTFFTLLAWEAARRWPGRKALAWSAAAALVLYVSFGRLYLGVHWPTDVLGGWALAAVQVGVALHFLRKHRG